ncbi:gamma-glutamyl-gamma-aminobutyrate hydrolase family protein [Microvirga subterranea]|uniref:Putative glutamine amidotransferase n=1 Tax=Microvirga subterranea TaxID=186651 RepID=A0A370HP10_9HYPH|nr:gamma-glutamyl-gamma-aminobutyrate hydrolase family protein [Microvirga subterranea]RDI60258.1 putative glutamine amidotransferase [Microvirga subterranea]
MSRKPRIAVIMDENTSVDGTRYDTSKAYFTAIHRAGGLPFGIPYLADLVGPVVEEFDGFVSVGGRINFPEAWYVEGDRSQYQPSDRLAVEQALMEGFLARNKPVLGICNGMQMLGCLHGCRMVSDVHASWPGALNHDERNAVHAVKVRNGTRLAGILDTEAFDVNTFHREALVTVSDRVVAAAHGPDGVFEAIEVPEHSFAVGLQWHPERFGPDENHPGTRVFDAFVAAARG